MKGTLVGLLALFALAAFAADAPLLLEEDQAVQLALAASQALAAKRAQTEAAESLLAAVEARRAWQVSLAASGSYRSSVPAITLPKNDGSSLVLTPDIRTVGSFSLALAKPLDVAGALEAATRAARQRLEAAQAQQQAAASEIAYAARVSFWELVAAEGRLRAAQQRLRRAQQALADSENLETAGLATPADVLAARAQKASAEVAVVKAASAVGLSRSHLRSLLALPPEQELRVRSEQPLPSLPASLAQLQRQAVERRAELVAQGREAEAWRWQKKEALASRAPTLQLVAQVDWARPNQRLFPLQDRWQDSWALSLLGSWLLADGGQRRAQARQAEALARASQASASELARQVALQVEQAYHKLANALSLVQAAEANVAAARAAEEATEDRFNAGLVSFSELVQAQWVLAMAEEEVVNARTEAFLAWAQLRRAVGE